MTAFRQPQFIVPNDEPKYRIRCPIHGFIRFSEHERQIVDHKHFQRLRYIRQLALTELVYPGASHTRFEHSLGVMEIATRAFDSLAAKRGDLLEETFKTVAGFEDKPLAKARQILRLAALLHDIGHAPFSHAAEEVVHKDFGHEKLSVAIIKEPRFLGKLIDECFWGVTFPTSGGRGVLFDEADGSIHKLFVPGDQDDKGLIDLYLVRQDRKPQSIIEVSQILEKIPRSFRCGRIFAGSVPLIVKN